MCKRFWRVTRPASSSVARLLHPDRGESRCVLLMSQGLAVYGKFPVTQIPYDVLFGAELLRSGKAKVVWPFPP